MQDSKQASHGSPTGPSGILDLMQPNMQLATSMMSPILLANIALLNWNARYCEKLAQGYKQWFDFVGHRLEEDASLAAQVHSAKDPKDVARACSMFVERATKDYQSEFTELTKLTKDLSNNATDALLSVNRVTGAVTVSIAATRAMKPRALA